MVTLVTAKKSEPGFRVLVCTCLAFDTLGAPRSGVSVRTGCQAPPDMRAF